MNQENKESFSPDIRPDIQSEIQVTKQQIENLNRDLVLAKKQKNQELVQSIQEAIDNFTRKLELLEQGIIPEPEEQK